MTKTEIDDFMSNWWVSDGKVFRYIREFMYDEYILIFKRITEPMFTVDASSTYKLGDLTREKMASMMSCRDLVYSTDQRSGIDCKYMKTGGCTCGSWIDTTYKHSDFCDIKTGKRWTP